MVHMVRITQYTEAYIKAAVKAIRNVGISDGLAEILLMEIPCVARGKRLCFGTINKNPPLKYKNFSLLCINLHLHFCIQFSKIKWT